MEPEQKLSRLQDFYTNRVIFLTGASGFLGRMTLEKILRSCPAVKKIYILLRAKKDKDTTKRLDELFDSVVFEKLHKENPDFKRKVTMVEGDCAYPDLGMKPEVLEVIMHEVDLIIHWAATIKFDENLKIATNINVRAVRDLIKMAKQMPQLKAFLHVSTAFSNCIHSEIDEKIYKVPISGEGLINTMNALDIKTVAKLEHVIMDKWPNSYVFTKAVTENMIRDEACEIPIGIVRPSMVLGSYKEPVPGWIDNVYGPTGTMMGMAIGLIRIMRSDLNLRAEVVPGDFVVNTSLAAIVDINNKYLKKNEISTNKRSELEEVPIYNVVSSVQSPIDWRDYRNLTRKHCMKIPSPKIIWHSIQLFTANPVLYYLGIYLLHYLPAYFIDAMSVCIGRKPLMVTAYNKIHYLFSTVSYFSTRSWRFKNNNVQELWKNLNEEDKKHFHFDLSNFDWDDYFYYFTRGGRTFLLKDSMETIPEGYRKMQILRVAHYALCTLLLFIFYKLCSWVLLFIYS